MKIRTAACSVFTLAWIGGLSLSLGCRRDSEARVYYEEAAPPQPSPLTSLVASQPEAAGDVRWVCPPGWTELPGSGFRLATFVVEVEGQRYECSLTALAGDGGGLEANLRRWAGQIGWTAEPAEWEKFLQTLRREGEGTNALVLADFSLRPGASPDSPSMLAAIRTRERDVVFLKMVAPVRVLQGQREAFESLARSLR